MNILLIFPANDFKEYGSLRPPLGLAYIAAVLEKEGHKIKILDLTLEKFNPKILDKIDIIGISVLTTMYKSAKILIKKLREINKNIPIVLGGPHPSIMPDLVLKENDINFIIKGEGEKTILELIDAIKNKKSFRKIKGLSYKRGKKTYHNPNRELIKDINKLPFPARHLLKLKNYKNYFNNQPATTIMSSRGCPFNCIYCYKGEGYKWRGRNAKNVVDEIESIIKNYNIKTFRFHDDLFTLDKQRVINICKEILRRKLKITWVCEARVDTINEEMLRWMKKAGCYNLAIGVESGDKEILKKIDKRITLSQAIKSFKLTKKVGIYTRAYFMIGFPWDTKETINKTIKFALKLNSDETQFTIVIPIPGSRLWAEYIKKKSIDLKNVDWDKFYMTTPNFSEKVYFTENLSAKEIINLRKKAYRKIIIHSLFKKLKEFDFKYIYRIIKEKKNIGLGKFMKILFLKK